MNKLLKNREEELRENNYYQDKPVMSIDDHVSLGKQTTLALLESMVERLEGEKLKKSGVGYRHSTGSWVGENRGSGYNHALKNQIDYLTLQIKEIKL